MPAPLPNLRDIGGMTTHDGRRVRHGRVLRSAVPLADDVVPAHLPWPPRVVIDLRSTAESESVHPLAAAGSRVVTLPLLSALRPGAAPPQTLRGLYLVLLEHAADMLVEVVREVGAAPGPILIHCAAGKDRTGVSVALLLRLLGVPREQVVTDYRATADAEAQITRRLEALRGAEHRATLPASFFDVSVEAIDGVLDVWDAHEGGVDGWFVRSGGNHGVLEQLRRTLVV